MNYELKRPKLIPVAILLILLLPLSLKFPFEGLFTETFLIGSTVMLMLFGWDGFRQLFQKMVAPWWFPIFVGVMMFFVEGFLMRVLIAAFGHQHQFRHPVGTAIQDLPNTWSKIWHAFIFLFSAVNEELLIIPILLTLYVLMKKKTWSWYVASFSTGLLFASLHFAVYHLYAGVVILLIASRMVLNETFKWCESIKGPMVVHFILDGISVLIALLL